MLKAAPGMKTSSLTAVTVMDSGPQLVLCPFFGKCDGLLLFGADHGPPLFLANAAKTSEWLCHLLIETMPRRLICGFVGQKEARALRSAGIDVRLALFGCSLEELVDGFERLPEA